MGKIVKAITRSLPMVIATGAGVAVGVVGALRFDPPSFVVKLVGNDTPSVDQDWQRAMTGIGLGLVTWAILGLTIGAIGEAGFLGFSVKRRQSTEGEAAAGAIQGELAKQLTQLNGRLLNADTRLTQNDENVRDLVIGVRSSQERIDSIQKIVLGLDKVREETSGHLLSLRAEVRSLNARLDSMSSQAGGPE
jgi:hypothetical protein